MWNRGSSDALPVSIGTNGKGLGEDRIITNGFEIQVEKGFSIYFGSRLTQKKIKETLKNTKEFENLVEEYVNRLSTGFGINYDEFSLDFGFYNMRSTGYILAFTLTKRSN